MEDYLIDRESQNLLGTTLIREDYNMKSLIKM